MLTGKANLKRLYVPYDSLYITIFFLSFCLSRAAPTAYGGSQARGPTGAVATGLHQSHSKVVSEPRLQPVSQLMTTPDPQSTEPGQRPGIKPTSSWMLVRFVNNWTTTGTSPIYITISKWQNYRNWEKISDPERNAASNGSTKRRSIHELGRGMRKW